MAKEQLKQLQKQRVKIDSWVTVAIKMGGWLVLVMLLVLVWHLLNVTRPILLSPSFELDYHITREMQHPVIGVTELDNQQWQFALTPDCHIEVVSSSAAQHKHILMATPQKTSWFPSHCLDSLKLVTSDAGVFLLKLSASGILRVFEFNPIVRNFDTQLFSTLLPKLTGISGLKGIQATFDNQHLVLLVEHPGGDWRFVQFDRKKPDDVLSVTIPKSFATTITQPSGVPHDVFLRDGLQMHHSEKLDLVYSKKQLLLLKKGHHNVSGNKPLWKAFREISAPDILALTSLTTKRSVLLINNNLELEKWALVNRGGESVLQKIYVLPMQGRSFKGLTHVGGDLAIVLVDSAAWFVNTATGEVLNVENHKLTFEKAWFTKGSVILERKNTFVSMKIADADATISFQSLWGKVWYDGYPQADYVWQTSSASDESQAKYSLMPLLMGSVKAAFLALVVAIPLAIGSAIYSGYYAAPKVRRVIKPYIEVLEAIPSVVIGFIAVIWLLPVSENYLVATVLFFTLTPVFLLIFVWLNNTGRHLGVQGWELVYFASILLLYIGLFQLLVMNNQSIWAWLTGGEIIETVSSEFKTTFVLALALGIAIVPTVFTIAEDAIHQVPRSLPLASFALGANRSQTFLKIILKVAMPGIVSAIMLGFARAVGETMIVLMVSGNTPVADWGLFEGIRTMTANLAIELPEARPGSMHYQILFLVALLLFVFTFVFNTLADFLRMQLRNRYKL